MKSLIQSIGAGSILALVIGLAFPSQARAVPISGEITFSGGTINLGDSSDNGTSDVLAATQILSFGGLQTVNTGAGAYAGLAGLPVLFSSFKFDDVSVVPLWTFSMGPIIYTFNASSIINDSFRSGGVDFLNLHGLGTASILGLGNTYDDTGGTWSITSTSTSTTFVFGASTTVPDSGATAIMLGLGLLGSSVAARRLKKKVG